MTIVTAFNQAFASVGEHCVKSLERYTLKFQHHKHEVHVIPQDYDRKPSWFKVTLLSNLLSYGNRVLWIDADAMIVGDRDIDLMVTDHMLNIARDRNGPNCGVMMWQPTPVAIQTLMRINSLYPQFKNHKWWEQGALMTFIDELEVFYQPKSIWNAYPKEVDGKGDESDETLIIHYPGMSIEERIEAITKRTP